MRCLRCSDNMGCHRLQQWGVPWDVTASCSAGDFRSFRRLYMRLCLLVAEIVKLEVPHAFRHHCM